MDAIGDHHSLATPGARCLSQRFRRKRRGHYINMPGCPGCVLCVLYREYGKCVPETKKSIAPAQSVIEYELRKFTDEFEDYRSVFQGPPTDARDNAWESLYDCQ